VSQVKKQLAHDTVVVHFFAVCNSISLRLYQPSHAAVIHASSKRRYLIVRRS
jgi:hypothetical protein